MPRSRKNPKRKTTRCTCWFGFLDYAKTRQCQKCKGTGSIPEPPNPQSLVSKTLW